MTVSGVEGALVDTPNNAPPLAGCWECYYTTDEVHVIQLGGNCSSRN